jgi:hypothetical protein
MLSRSINLFQSQIPTVTVEGWNYQMRCYLHQCNTGRNSGTMRSKVRLYWQVLSAGVTFIAHVNTYVYANII